MLKHSMLFLLLVANTQADMLSDAGDFFTKKFTDVKSILANDETVSPLLFQ